MTVSTIQPYGAGPYYDLVLARRPERAAFIARRFRGFRRLLDVGAGNGEIAFALARRGHEMVCLEPSRTMFALLLGRLPALGADAKRITPLRMSAETRQRFRIEAAYCCSVFHLVRADAARRRLLRAIFRQLPPGGRLIFDYVGMPAPQSSAPRVIAQGRFGAVEYRHWNGVRRLRDTHYAVDWLVEGKLGGATVDRYKESFHVRTDAAGYWPALVAQCGGEVIEIHDGYPAPGRRTPVVAVNRRVVVARRIRS